MGTKTAMASTVKIHFVKMSNGPVRRKLSNEIDSANELLDKSVLKKFNKKFTKPAADSVDDHRDASLFGDLNQIICLQIHHRIHCTLLLAAV